MVLSPRSLLLFVFVRCRTLCLVVRHWIASNAHAATNCCLHINTLTHRDRCGVVFAPKDYNHKTRALSRDLALGITWCSRSICGDPRAIIRVGRFVLLSRSLCRDTNLWLVVVKRLHCVKRSRLPFSDDPVRAYIVAINVGRWSGWYIFRMDVFVLHHKYVLQVILSNATIINTVFSVCVSVCMLQYWCQHRQYE